MAMIRGFEFPEDLYYVVDKHVWARPVGEGLLAVGLTPVAYHVLRHSLVAISILRSVLGREVRAGKSVAMVESLKYNGPVSAPFDGVVVRANETLGEDPGRAERDPYGEGWIVEMRPTDRAVALSELAAGAAAIDAYRALLETQGIGR